MDFQHREGATGSAGVAGFSESNVDRRERLRRLALETIDLTKDPYFMKNHLGSYECKLCLTLHNNEGSYLAHTQGKKHQNNLARRAFKEAALSGNNTAGTPGLIIPKVSSALHQANNTHALKIGRPGYRITKIRSENQPENAVRLGCLIQIHYPQISKDTLRPVHRFMSAFEQRVDTPPNKDVQYLVVAANPYESIAFKMPSREIIMASDSFLSHWDKDHHLYTIQFLFK